MRVHFLPILCGYVLAGFDCMYMVICMHEYTESGAFSRLVKMYRNFEGKWIWDPT